MTTILYEENWEVSYSDLNFCPLCQFKQQKQDTKRKYLNYRPKQL